MDKKTLDTIRGSIKKYRVTKDGDVYERKKYDNMQDRQLSEISNELWKSMGQESNG